MELACDSLKEYISYSVDNSIREEKRVPRNKQHRPDIVV